MTRPRFASLPVAPLVAALAARPESRTLLLGENLDRSLFRVQRSGRISVMLADRIAVEGLHVHPSSIWGDLWFASAPEAMVPA